MKLHAVGGYNEVGKNMTAVEVDGEIVIFDMGYDMETVIEHDEDVDEMTTTSTIESGAIPDDSDIHERKEDVKAIVIGHGHLDHVGAVPKLAGSYDCPVIATPFTMSIIERMAEEDRKSMDNELVRVNAGEKYEVSDNLTVELVDITHSIPGAVCSVLHTPEGAVAYSLDFKLDDRPVLGDPSDYERMRELADEGVKLLIADATRVTEDEMGSSESEVKIQLEHVVDHLYNEGGAAIITTFSSHIERLNSILDANNGRRKVAFVGRSLKEYTQSAEELGLIDLSDVEVASYRDEKEQLFSRIADEREEWLVICTGNQGEPNAVLTRLARGEHDLEIGDNDHVVFSSDVIPSPASKANRYRVEKILRESGAKVIKEVHASGHAKREDCRRLVRLLEPEVIVPASGTTEMLASFAELGREEGYTLNEDFFICENGSVLEI
ncbi:MAG: RNase J family beta-CASP ribonuclease [Candidatus Nanohaloarchaea archaeon]|nr:RNase J family beta-CASP ribonuclease [Candidatus Nanohaloarchaea archaeon]